MKNEDVAILKQEARSIHLVYTTDKMPGYSREKKETGFIFSDSSGKELTDEDELKRIRSLVMPPAWIHVWISAKPNGHLQATGIDAAGRKQYKYHPHWGKMRNEKKHNQMSEFARALPLIRQKAEEDLGKNEFTREKVVALAISVLDKTFIRVGNSSYTKLYGSYGLTSLRNRHVQISGSKMKISFRGKKGVQQEITLSHARLSRLISKLKDIPGHELFQYYDSEGAKHSLNSEDINDYIEACCGKSFTAKDFRTWWGTVTAAVSLAELSQQPGGEPKKILIAALDKVAKKLGNTRTVCKKYYVHPALLSEYEEGKLEDFLGKIRKVKDVEDSMILKPEEKLIMSYILKQAA
jgi:DNA topoisomerase-1